MMCFLGGGGSQQSSSTQAPNVPAPAPAAPVPAPEPPKIGETRREENLSNYGSESPEYRVRRKKNAKPEVGPQGGPIQM